MAQNASTSTCVINEPTVLAVLNIRKEDKLPISYRGYINLVAMFIEDKCPQLQGMFDKEDFGHMGGVHTIELGNETYYVEEKVQEQITISCRDNMFTWF